MSQARKSELALRDKAVLHQQRRLKQATQFSHKDSADLLPLDGLKRLGTSKDLVSAPGLALPLSEWSPPGGGLQPPGPEATAAVSTPRRRLLPPGPQQAR